MKEISLSRNMVALVDDEDYGALSAHKWSALKGGVSSVFYATRNVDKKHVLMHRILLGAPAGMHVDHINGNGLDNRRENLRLATHAQNLMNRGANKNNRSGFKGVCWDTQCERWRAAIQVGSVHKNLGRFDDPEEAYSAYCAAARELHGEFARTS